MSVLNQSGEEQVECPLCMEPFEVDDLNFFPCTCGYQICRFCWHRIRTDENGLCPACRKAYSENPADFTPLSKEQVAQLKATKRQREQQRKAKLSESRKHLASVRVVQRNLVFVVGLPLRLADPEILKKHEYFGKFGKIHKVVINQSPSYAGTQGPSASAYVTYMKSDDALRAIQSVNNITLDGRLIKSSLGTTKYCSHFMKNQPCPKPDCMYLHDFGDPEASFTKEQMHAGKHQEYEKKLHEALLSKAAIVATQNTQNEPKQSAKNKENVTQSTAQTSNSTNKENWPQLNQEKGAEGAKTEKKPEGKTEVPVKEGKAKSKSKAKNVNNNNNNVDKKLLEKGKNCETVCQTRQTTEKVETAEIGEENASNGDILENKGKLTLPDDNSSFFSQTTFQKIVSENAESPRIFGETLLNINSTEDWEAAFGFSKHSNHLEELAKQRNNVKGTLEMFGSDFGGNEHNGYPQNGYDIKWLQENVLDVLSSGNKHTITPNHQNGYQEERVNFPKEVNGLDQQMSKFFTDFYKQNVLPSVEHQNYLVHHRQQIEEQLLNMNLKSTYNPHNLLPNGLNGSQFLNGDILNTQNGSQYGQFRNHTSYQDVSSTPSLNQAKNRTVAEDELDFDPFQETQKALAELIENEQNHKMHSRSGVPINQMNGLLHSHNNIGSSQLPPPPPGFLQQTTHMNSFGSKILPYLNMKTNSPQHQQQQMTNNSTQHNNWPGNYSHLQQQQQHKGGMSTCNDWKVLDPAIVSSSRHFPLANMQQPPSIRDHFNTPPPHLGSMQNGTGPGGVGLGPVRPYDYNTHNTFSNFTQQIQPNINGYTPQNLNWLSNDMNSQISSPPGFRSSNQNTKQQEC